MKLSHSSSLPRISLSNLRTAPPPRDSSAADRRIGEAANQAQEAADVVTALMSATAREVAAANRESSLSRPEDAERIAEDLGGAILRSPREALAAQTDRLERDAVHEKLA